MIIRLADVKHVKADTINPRVIIQQIKPDVVRIWVLQVPTFVNIITVRLAFVTNVIVAIQRHLVESVVKILQIRVVQRSMKIVHVKHVKADIMFPMVLVPHVRQG